FSVHFFLSNILRPPLATFFPYTTLFRSFYDLLYKLNKEKNITMLLVTHDTGAVTKYATEIACINQKLHFHGKACVYQSLSQEKLSEIYGHPVHIVVHDHD